MAAEVLGVSGSPVKNSNTDRLVKAVLAATGRQTEFIKLSRLKVGPCIACLGCVKDNVCRQNDDFPALAEKLKAARALVVGGHPTYGSLNGISKCFLERFYSLRHQRALNRGKLSAVVVVGNGRGAPGREEVARQMAYALKLEGFEHLGEVIATGNPNCLVCGFGEECDMGAVLRLWGPGTKIEPAMFSRVEEQPEAMARAEELGREIGRRLSAQV